MFAVSAATGLTVWGNTKPQTYETESLQYLDSSSISTVWTLPEELLLEHRLNTSGVSAVQVVHVTANGGSRPLLTATPTAVTSQSPANTASEGLEHPPVFLLITTFQEADLRDRNTENTEL